MLTLENVTVAVEGRPVLRSVDLIVPAGEIHALFGPNGAGKTALIMAIMGLPRYRVTEGRVVFQGEDITHLPHDERARRGIALFYQRPPTVHGVPLKDLVALCRHGTEAPVTVLTLAERLHCTALLDRDVNDGFSGGEIKLSELLQLVARGPDLALIDEPDSGVDVDNLAIVGSALRELFTRNGRMPQRSALLITHSGRILDFLGADVGHLVVAGTLERSGDPRRLLADIRSTGYGGGRPR